MVQNYNALNVRYTYVICILSRYIISNQDFFFQTTADVEKTIWKETQSRLCESYAILHRYGYRIRIIADKMFLLFASFVLSHIFLHRGYITQVRDEKKKKNQTLYHYLYQDALEMKIYASFHLIWIFFLYPSSFAFFSMISYTLIIGTPKPENIRLR